MNRLKTYTVNVCPISRYMGSVNTFFDDKNIFTPNQTDMLLSREFNLQDFYAHIYVLIDPRTSEIKYVGKANNLKDRLDNHLHYYGKCRKTSWIKSLKKEGLKPLIESIDIVLQSEWVFWEKHYISLYRSWGILLLNDTDGGDGTSVGYWSEEKREEVRNAKKNYWNRLTDDEKREKGEMLASYTKKELDRRKELGIEHWNKNHTRNKGKKVTDQNLLTSMSKRSKKMWSEKTETDKNEIKINLKASRDKAKSERESKGIQDPRTFYFNNPVLQFNKVTGELIKEYTSISKAENETGIYNTSISSCAKSKLHTAGKFLWIFKKDFTQEVLSARIKDIMENCHERRHSFPVLKFDSKGDLVHEYKCLAEAGENNEGNVKCINECAMGKYNTYYGFIWIYKFRFTEDLLNKIVSSL